MVRGVDLPAALVNRAENGFDTRSGLRHERRGSRRGNRQHGDVAAAHTAHLLVESRIGLADAGDHRVVLLLGRIVDRERTALGGHLHRSPVSLHGQRLLHLDGKVDRLLRTVAQPECRQHVALGRNAQAGTAAFPGHRADLLPQLELHVADILVLRIRSDLLDDQLDLLQLEIDDVVHHVHGLAHMLAEFREVKLRLRREGVVHIAEEVERQQAARIVGTERDFAARVGRYGHEALVCIAVGNALADDRIPEQHARLGRFPRIVDDLLPKFLRIDVLLVFRVVRVDRELLVVLLAGQGRTHEFIVDLDRDIGTGHLARIDLGVDEALGIRMLDRQRKHQRTAATVLGHLTRGVRVTLHEGDDTRRSECRVEHRAARRADVREVMPHTATSLHELHLLLVHAENAAIGVGRMLVSDDEAVRERSHLEVVADTGHRAALRDHVTEMVEQSERLLLRHRIGIVALDALDLGGDTLVHLPRGALVDVAEGVLQGILADPDRSSQVIAPEVPLRLGHRIVVFHTLRRLRLIVHF